MFYILKEPLQVEDYLGCWSKHMGRFSLVAGHTSFGDVFLNDPDSGQFAILCPITGERYPTKCFDRKTFKDEFLCDPDIIERFARPTDVDELAIRLGPLKPEEVYPCSTSLFGWKYGTFGIWQGRVVDIP